MQFSTLAALLATFAISSTLANPLALPEPISDAQARDIQSAHLQARSDLEAERASLLQARDDLIARANQHVQNTQALQAAAARQCGILGGCGGFGGNGFAYQNSAAGAYDRESGLSLLGLDLLGTYDRGSAVAANQGSGAIFRRAMSYYA